MGTGSFPKVSLMGSQFPWDRRGSLGAARMFTMILHHGISFIVEIPLETYVP